MVSMLCIILAAICNAIMDKLAHHYDNSIFSELNRQFWDPKISWKNKYEWNGYFAAYVRKQWKLFGISFNIHPAFTDAWHLFKSSMIILLALAIVTYDGIIPFFGNVYITLIIDFLFIGFLWNRVFLLFYKTILND
jgi:hypothetical protein